MNFDHAHFGMGRHGVVAVFPPGPDGEAAGLQERADAALVRWADDDVRIAGASIFRKGVVGRGGDAFEDAAGEARLLHFLEQRDDAAGPGALVSTAGRTLGQPGGGASRSARQISGKTCCCCAREKTVSH